MTRMIDADALIALIEKERQEDKVTDGFAFFLKAYVADAPTIEPNKSTDQNVADVPSGDEYVPNKACFDCMERGTGFCKGTIQEQSWCPIVAKTNTVPSGDLISRADAKKEVYLLGKNPSTNEIWDCLDALPSADYSKPLQTTLNGDLISRADAIDVANKIVEELSSSSIYWNDLKYWAKELFDALPSADAISIAEVNEICSDCEKETNEKLQHIKELSARPKGEWIDVEHEPYCECSVCGAYIENLDNDFAFCPRCGADMRPEK